jgi:signal transduction histidine kinase
LLVLSATIEVQMEGSPARGQKLDGLIGLLVTINDASTMAEFGVRLLSGIASQLQHGQVLLITRNLESGELDTENLRSSEDTPPISPSWLRSHLDRHPELPRKLRQGEMVGITHVEGSTTPQPASLPGARRNLLLLPMIVSGDLVGVIGLALPVEALQYSEDEVEFVRQVSHYISPAIARLEELEKLRSHYRENESLRAILEMQKHLQSNVAHELRTPLATVRGYTRMILDGRVGEIPQTQRDYLNIVTENANRLIGLVNWMSHLLQYGTQHLDIVSTDLKELWTACLRSQAAAISEKNITVQQQIPADAFVIPCDRRKIEFVFTSVLANAIRSSELGGRIVVEFSRGRQKEISVKVTDFGGGLPPEQLNKIFERYYGSAFPAANPIDLGLAGVYDIIGLHGGRLFVNSSPAEGSTFLFTLPAVRQESMEKTG